VFAQIPGRDGPGAVSSHRLARGAGESFQQKAFPTMTSDRDLVIIQADLGRPDHQAAVVAITAAYALDPMANGEPLPADVLDRLIPGLRAHPTTLVFLASVGGAFVGLATCFVGFSTFAARPVVNLHDLCVLAPHRGHGIGRAILEAVEKAAVERGCAKVTLEVLEHNRPARKLYESLGFTPAVYRPENGLALFYAKSLPGA
jgi:ribosomal protein S18 acetylase RimI-like enzyme